MKALIFNHHPDCAFYVWKALNKIGIQVDFATEQLTINLGFPNSSTKNNKFEVVNRLYSPEEFNKDLKDASFSSTANHDIYLSTVPEVIKFFGPMGYWDARMQFFLRNFGSLNARKSVNHPDAEKFGFKFCSNWIPNQNIKLENPKLITQLITQHQLVKETPELLRLKKDGYPVVVAGGDNCEDGFIRDIDILPKTSMLVHNKQFGINCYAVCKALDSGIPVYMGKDTKEIIGFGDLPDELFLFKEQFSIIEAYKKSLSIDRKKIQDTYRSIYTLERTVSSLKNCLS